MSSTSLVTRGMICYSQILGDKLMSCAHPDTTSVLEVRPKIRRAAAEDPVSVGPPSILSAREVKPRTSAQAEQVPSAPEPPTILSGQEMKPKIVKIEEED